MQHRVSRTHERLRRERCARVMPQPSDAKSSKASARHLPRVLWLIGGQHAITMMFELLGRRLGG